MFQKACLVLACATAACSQQNSSICDKPSAFKKTEAMDACAHRWAYRLAKSSDPAEIVAKAVVEACGRSISMEADASHTAEQVAGDPSIEYGRLLTDMSEIARRHALFRVVQARAGNCDIPG